MIGWLAEPQLIAKFALGPPSLRFGAAAFAFHFVQSEGWWLGAELNRRHKDFQSSALPTELPSQRDRALNLAFDPLARSNANATRSCICASPIQLVFGT
jgi:hypothetical protein